MDIRQLRRQSLEDIIIQWLARSFDRLPGARDEVIGGPVVQRHAYDGASEKPAPLEPVESAKGLHPRQVARDPEYDQDVRLGTRIRFLASSRHLFSVRSLIEVLGGPQRAHIHVSS
jgi:hypothetical protein